MGKKRKRSSQHLTDLEDFPDKHKPACLNAHHSAYKEGNTCSYRWQAHLQATTDSKEYRWPKNYGLQPPRPGAWDVGTAGNFQDKCTVPYWHESHHIVPHAELTNAITWVGGDSPKAAEISLMIRGGLLDEGYNLNDKINMIILPMISLHARAIRLPKHRLTPTTFHHAAYSRLVLAELKTLFRPMQEKASKHEVPDYVLCKQQIEELSTDLYPQIKSAGRLKNPAESLEDIQGDHLLANRSPAPQQTSINDPLT